MPSIYDRITQDFITRIENGAGKFDMPWHTKGCKTDLLPVNATTGKLYNGANALQFWAYQKGTHYSSNVWATYKQWQALGAQVRKGERSAHGIYWKRFDNPANDDASQDKATVRLAGFGFNVFNADQVEGWSADQLPTVAALDRTNPIATADAVLAGSGADIRHGGGRAFFSPSKDFIQLPERWRFIGTATATPTETYYATALHELTHWTGGPARLNRALAKRFGDEAHAFEELVAEIGAAFLCARLGVTNVPMADHAAYVAHWLKVLRNDNRAIVTAASLAQKATDFVLNRLAPPQPEQLAA